MEDKIIVALGPNQGHALAILEELAEEKNKLQVYFYTKRLNRAVFLFCKKSKQCFKSSTLIVII